MRAAQFVLSNSKFSVSLLARVTLALFSVLSLNSCKQGNSELDGGLFSDLTFPVIVATGGDQIQARGLMFDQTVRFRVVDTVTGFSSSGMQLELRQLTNTDAVIERTSGGTDEGGYFSTRVRAPTTYNQTVRIEARIIGSDSSTIVTLYSVSDEPRYVEFLAGFLPPAAHEASPTVPMPAFKVQVRDYFGYVINTNSSGTINLSVSTGTGTIGGTASAILANGIATFSNVIYTKAENIVLRATYAGNGIYGQTPIGVFHGPADHIQFTTAPANPSISGVSLASVVTVQDISNNTVSSGADSGALITLNLQSGTGTLLGTTALVANAGVADFSSANLTLDMAGVKTVRASKPNLTGTGGQGAMTADATFTVNAASAVDLQLAGPTSFNSGDCQAFTVTLHDAFGNLAVRGGASVLALTGKGSGEFYSTVACSAGSEVSTLNFGAADSTKVYYYRTTVAPQSLTFGVDDGPGNLNPATLAVTVNVNLPYKFVVTGASPIKSGVCVGPYTVQLQDVFSNPRTALTDTVSELAGGSGTFYSAAGCGVAVTQITLLTGSASAQVWYRNTVAESTNLVADDGPGALLAGTLPIVVTPDRLDLAGASQIRTGDCSLYSVTTRDTALSAKNVNVNTTINLVTSSGTGVFYATTDTTCAGAAITTVSIASGAQTSGFRYRDNNFSSATLTISDQANYLASDTHAVAAGPRQGHITGPTPIRSGDCDLYTLTTKDAAGTDAGVLLSTTFDLADGVGSGQFYAATDTACVGTPMTSVVFAIGASVKTFRYKNMVAETVNVAATDAAAWLLGNTKSVVNGPRSLDLAGAAFLAAGECGAFSLTSRDAAGTAAGVVGNTTINLNDGVGSGQFFVGTDTTCAGAPITDTVLVAGASVINVRYRNVASESITLVADDAVAYLVGDTHSLAVGPDHLSITGATQLYASECSLFTVTALDAGNAAGGVLVNTTVNLNDGAASGTLYADTDTTCTGSAISSIVIPAASSAKNFRYKNLKAENVTFTAADNAAYLTADTHLFAVGPDRLILVGSAGIRSGDCSLYTFTTKDGLATNAGVLNATTVTLDDGAAAGGFYAASDTTCSGTAIADIALAIGVSSGSFRYKDQTAESSTLTIDEGAGGLTASILTVAVSPRKLILSGPTILQAGQCVLLTLNAQDAASVNANVLTNTTVNVSDGVANGLTYAASDTTCVGAPVTSVTIASGSNTTSFRYKNDSSESVIVTADDNAALLDSAAHNLSIGPDRLVITGVTPIRAGDCTVYTINSKDSTNSNAGVLANTTINLNDGAASGVLFAGTDTTCAGAPISSVLLALGQNAITFRYKNDVAEVPTLSAVDAGAVITTGTLAVTVGPRLITVAGASALRAGECSLYTVTTKDNAATAANVLASTQVNINDGVASGVFYAATDTTCSGAAVTSATIASGAQTITFRYSNPVSENVTFNLADNASLLNGTTHSLAVGPNRLVLTGATPIRAGDCEVYTVTSRDVSGNAASVTVNTQVNITDGAASGIFYAAGDTTCAGAAITDVTIAAATSAVTFRYRNQTSEAFTMQGADNANFLATATLSISVGPTKLMPTGPVSILAGECAPFTVVSRDDAGVAANVVLNTTVNLDDGVATGTFFASADTTCAGAAITSVSIATGANTASYRYKNPKAESVSLTSTDASAYLNSSAYAFSVGPSRYILSGATPIRADDCTVYTVTLHDENSAVSNALANLTVSSLTDGTASGTFYAAADTTCVGAAISSVVVSTGTSSTTFRWKDTVGEAVTLGVDDGAGNLAAGNLPVVIGPRKLNLTGTTPIRSGDCSAFTVTSQDAANNAKNVLSNTVVNLDDGAASGLFYAAADPTCAGLPLTSVSIASGASSASFFYKTATAETIVLAATDNVAYLDAASLNVTAGPQVYQLTGATPIRAGDCGLYTITTKDAAGNTTNALTNLSVNQLVDSSPTGAFYAATDTTCSGGVVTNVTVATGTSSVNFRWKDSKAELVTLSVDDGVAGLEAGTFGVTVGPDHLLLTGAGAIRAGDCALYTVTAKDVDGTTSNVLSLTTVNVTDGAAAGVFYAAADTTCAGAPVSSVSIASGASSTQFRYADFTTEAVTLSSADNASYLTSSTLGITVGLRKLNLTGASPVRAGDCTVYTVTTQDANNVATNTASNVTVNLTDASAAGVFYAAGDTTCSGSAITSVIVGTGTSSVTFRYKDATAESLTLSAADSSALLDAATLPVVVGPDRLLLTGASPIKAGECASYTITSKDVAGNAANALSNVTVNIADGAGSGVYYAVTDTTCAGAPVTSVTLLSGSSSVSVRYKNDVSESVTFDADDGASYLTSASLPVVIGPDRLVLTGNTQVRAGDCEVYTVTSRDVAGSAKNVLGLTTVNVTDGAAAGVFYAAADTTCVGAAISSVSIASGASTATFRYKDLSAQSATLSAADAATSLTAGTLAIDVGPRSYKLTGTTPVRAGDCSIFTITTKDANNATANALSALNINSLVDGTATGEFFAAGDTTCAGSPVTSLSIALGANNVQFRWKNTTAESVTLTVDDGISGLEPDSLSVTAGPDHLLLTGNTPVRSGDCTAYTVTSKDVAGNSANVLSGTTVNLSDGIAAGIFYANVDTTCVGAPVSSISISSGASSAGFYYKNNTAESVTLVSSDGASSLTSSSLGVVVGPRRYDLTGTSVIRAGDCSLYTVTTKDHAGAVANAITALTINSITDATATGEFYAATDTTCAGAAITSLSIAIGASSVQFRWKDTVAENVTLTVDDGVGATTLDAGTLAVGIGPDRLTIAGSTPIRSGDCTAYTVTSRDVAGNAKNVLSTTTVNLTDAAAAGVFYGTTDTSCASAPVTSVSMTTGTSNVVFYYKDNTAESLTLNAADNAAYLTDGTLPLVVGPRVYQISGTNPVRAGECSLYTITTKDAAGATATALSALSVNSLTDGTATGEFYAATDTTCVGAPVSSVSIASGASTGQFRWKNTVGESVTLTVDDGVTGLEAGTLNLTVGPDRLTLAGSSPIRSGDCTIYTVTSRDTTGTAKNVTSATTVNLTDAAAAGVFYAATDTTCVGAPVSSVSIASGANNASFYYKDNTAEGLTLTAADNAAYLTTATLGVITGPHHYALTGTNPVRAGECAVYTITTKDAANVTANALSALSVNSLIDGTAMGEFYALADTTCAGAALTSVAISSGASSGQFRWKDTTAQAVTLTVDDGVGGLDAGTLAVTVGPDRITIAGTTPIRANECSLYTMTIRDSAGNAANVLANTTVNISDGVASGNFYDPSDTTCAGGTITSRPILAGASTASFRYKDAVAEAIVLNADDSIAYLASGTLNLTVGPDRLVITGNTPVRAGDCEVYTVTAKDASGSAKNVLSSTTVNISDATAAGIFYAATDTTCVGAPVSSVSIASGANNTTFRYKDNTAETLTLTAADNATYLTAGTLGVVVGPVKYTITGTTPIKAGDCSLYTVTTKDAANATANALSALSINSLTDGSATGDFYAATDTTCAGAAITSLSIASGSNAVQFRFKDNVGASLSLGVDDGVGGLDAGTYALVVGPNNLDLIGASPIRSGDCTAYTIISKDVAGNAKNVTSTTTVNLSDAAAPGIFYGTADTTCASSAVGSVSIASGSNSTTFYYKDNTAESVTLTIADNAGSLLGDTLGVILGPQKYAVTGTTPIRAGDCSLYTITTKDANNTTANALSALSVNSLVDGSATGEFYADTDTTCALTAITSVSIASGASSGQFRFKETVGATRTLTVDDGVAGLNSGSLAVVVGPSWLDLTGTTPTRSGDCSLFTITSKDVSNAAKNVTVATTVNINDGAGAGVIYAATDTTCVGAAIASVSIASGANNTTFRYKDNTAEAITLTIADNASYLAGDTLAFNVGPLTYSVTGTSPIRAGDCSLYTITTKDAANVTANALSALTINALTDGTATGNFYAAADTTCVGAVQTQYTIASGANTTTFRWRDTVGESITLSVDDGAGGLNAGTLGVVVGPNRLGISGTAPIRSGDCTLYTVTSLDVAGSAKNVLSATTVNITDATAAGIFYAATDTTCVGAAVSSVSIASGASATTFRYKDNTAENVTLSAADNAAYLTTGTLAVGVGPQFYSLTGTSPIRSGTCTLYTITTKDAANVTANALSALVINSLVDSTATGEFYAATDTTCVGAAQTSYTIASGANNVTFRWRETVAGARTLTVDDGAGGLNSGSLPVTVGPDRLDIAGNTVLARDACGPFTITARDTALNAANVLSNTTVNLTDGVASGQFYDTADTTCVGAPITSKQILSGANTVTVNYRNASAELATLQVDDNAAQLISDTLLLEVGSDHFQITGSTPIRAGECLLYTVTTENSSNVAENVFQNSVVTLNDGAALGVFYADTDTTCVGAPIPTITITTGTSSKQFRYRNTKAESVTFTVDDGAGGRNAGTFALVVGPNSILITGAALPSVNTCVAYTISTRDLTPANAGVLTTTQINLAGGSGQFYATADTTCVGAPITSLSLAAAAFSQVVYYKNAVSELVSITATDNAAYLTAGTLAIQNAADRFSITGNTPIKAGACEIYTVTSQNAALAAQNVLATATVTISDAAAAGIFYAVADTTCVGAVQTSVTITAGTNSAQFRYKDNTAQAATLTAAQSGRTSGTLALVVNPDRLLISGAAGIPSNNCALYTINSRDAQPANANVAASTTVNLTDTSATGNFYAATDTTCVGGTITSAQINAAANSVQFRYKDAVAEGVTLTATDNAAYLTTSNLAVTVGPDRLILTGSAAIRAGDCTAYTVTTKDSGNVTTNVYGAVTVNLADGAAAGSFYAAGDTSCSGGAVTSTTIALGTSATTVYYKDPTAESATLTASDAVAVLTSSNVAVTVGARKLTISGTTPQPSGTCALFTVNSRDVSNNLVNVASNTTVNLTDAAATGIFYAAADTGCSGGPISSVQITSGSNNTTFRYKVAVSESMTLTATDNAAFYDVGTLAVAFGPDRLDITGATSALTGTCQSFTITSKDSTATTANVLANTTVNLSDGVAPGIFYAAVDTTCVGGAITNVVISNGSSSTTFRYKTVTAANVTLNADDNAAVLTSDTHTILFGPTKLTITGSASILGGACTAYTINTRDTSNNITNASSAVNITIGDGAGSGLFYAPGDATCVGAPVTSTSIASGANSVVVYYKDATFESVTLSASDNATVLTTGTLAVSINDPCPVDHYLVEATVAGSPVTTVAADQVFDVRLTAKNSSNVTQTCLSSAKTISWTMNGTTGTADCGASGAAPVAPSQTAVTFASGVVTTSSANAKFTFKQTTATVQASDGTASGTSSNITVNAGAACRIRIMSAATNLGSDVTSSSIDLNAVGSTTNSSATVYAAGFDKYGNYAGDQTVVWTGTNVVYPVQSQTTIASDTALVVGVKVGTGTLQADFSGGGSEKTDTVSVTVSSANATANWTSATTDAASNTHLGTSANQAVRYWDVTNDAVNAWRTAGTQSWYAEAAAANVRGGRKDFPQKAFLITHASGLDVVDATTNRLYMRFTSGAGRVIDSNFGTPVSVAGLNGKIFIALRSGTTTGSLVVVDLQNDVVRRYAAGGEYNWSGTPASRNTGGTWTLSSAAKATLSNIIYDVDVKRIGSVDYALLGTHAGASLYQNNSGTVSVYGHSLAPVTSVAISADSKLYYGESGVGVHRADPTLPVSASFTNARTYTGSSNAEIQSLTFNDLKVANGTSGAQASRNTLIVAGGSGVTVIQEHDTFASSTSVTYGYKGTGQNTFSGAVAFNGTGDYAQIASAGSNIGPGAGASATVEFWFRPAVTLNSGSSAVVLYQRGTGNNQLSMRITAGRLQFQYTTGAGTTHNAQSAVTTWNAGQWYHVAGVMTSSGLTLWYDGANQTSVAATLTTETTDAGPTTLGADTAFGNLFNGAIDELRVSKTARYAAATYTVPSSAFTNDGNTVHLFHFNDGSGTSAAYSDADSMQTATLNGDARFFDPILAGSSDAVAAVGVAVSGSSCSVHAISSGASGAWSEILNAHTSAGSLGTSATSLNGASIDIYQVDSVTDSDVILGHSTGVRLIRE